MIDIVIHNVALRNTRDEYCDIAINDGKIEKIAPKINEGAEIIIDGEGQLCTESFINPHLHLCKVYTLDKVSEETLLNYHGQTMGDSMSAIEQASSVKNSYNEETILQNARKAVAKSIYYGCTHIRAFADVDGKAGLKGIKALVKVKKEFENIVDVQVVAFPQDGIIREPLAKDLMIEAIAAGADVAGGIPWIELTDQDVQDHVKYVFDIAEKFNKDVSMLVDDAGDPDLRSLEMMAIETINRNWQGRSLAHHARAMEMYSTPYINKLFALLKKADMGIVTDPHTGPLHAKVKDLIKEDILVCLGQDDISDAYYPFGRNNMLEVAFLASHLLWFTTQHYINKLYDMITLLPAKAIGLKNHRIQEGSEANLIILNQQNEKEAFRFHDAPKYVISHGRLIDQQKYKNLFY